MVVGLLAVLAVLALAFFLTSHLEALRSEAEAQRAPADPIARGIVERLVAMLKADRRIDATRGPYGEVGSGSAGWMEYIDAPLEASDPHVASISPYFDGATWKWKKLTNPYGAPANTVADVLVTSTTLADTNGDTSPTAENDDAVLYPVGVTNTLGDEYYAAVRMTDLTGRICLNTAARGGSGELTTPIHPVNVSLVGLLGESIYDNVHRSRYGAARGSTAPTMPEFDTECALRIMLPKIGPLPQQQYRPFATGDEMYLRWLGDKAPTEVGRVHGLLKTLSLDQRKLLTVYNTSSVFLRHPVKKGSEAWPYDDFATQAYLKVGNAPRHADRNRQAAYKRMLALLDKLGLGTSANARKRMAACFVANLWAYQSAGDTDRPWPFIPRNQNDIPEHFMAFGLIQRLVITEAYAKHKPNTGGPIPKADYIWGHAVELMNPTTTAINLASCRLRRNGTLLPALNGVVQPGQKMVLYDWGKGSESGKDQTEIGFPNPFPAHWKQVAGLTFEDGATIRLVEPVNLGAGMLNIPVDQVSAADLGYGASDMKTDAAEAEDIRRDDSLARVRFNVAVHKSFNTGHRLGQSNGLAPTDLCTGGDPAKYPVPIIRRQTDLASIGECLRVYLTGPLIDNNELKAFPQNVKDSGACTIFANVMSRGRLDPHPENINHGGYAPSGASDYPDVPAAVLLGEFFTLVPPDEKRSPKPGSRVYGRINLNTAPPDVLKALPFPSSFRVGGTTYPVDPVQAADYILAYRDMRATADGARDYGNRSAPAGAGMSGLRSIGGAGGAAGAKCFLTAGEVAIPLADYANRLMGWVNYSPAAEPLTLTQRWDYLDARDSLYHAISNLVAVRSDAYAATIRVQLGKPAKLVWYYVAVIDRSNCYTPAHSPAVLLFSEVK